jgi:D-alanyl-D-alanine carboxypeptidase
MFRRRALGLVAGAALVAITSCACSSPPTISNSGIVDGGGPGSDAETPDGASAACEALRADLQAAIDGARKSPNATVAASTPECASIVVVSGAPQTGSADSLWRLASVTKTYVSATILSLAKGGTTGLDDLLSKWVPNVPKTAGVTLRMLLNHTSGIFNFNDDPSFTRTVAWTPTQLVQMATQHDPYFAPGTGFHYSNTDYVLLGLVAEAAGNAKLGVLLHQHAIDKANLRATFFSGEDQLVGMPTRGFDGSADITDTALSYATWAAGSIVARPADALDWIRKLYATTEVLDSDQQALLLENPVSAGAGYQYGLGVQIYAAFYKGEKAVGHMGDTTGFHTWAFWFPNRKLAFVAMVNEEGTSPDAVGHAALDVLLR